jgi:hypothetical protein
LDFILSHVDVPLDAAWRGEYPEPRTYSPEEWMSALSISRDLVEAGTYHDVHCWVFTPTHFIELMTHFAEMGLMQLKCDWVTNTRPGAVEFFASMSQSADAREALASWQEALTRVTPNSSPEELVADRVLTESEPKVPMDWIHTVGWEGLEITIKVAPR